MSDLKEKFDQAVKFVQSGKGGFRPTNEIRLEMYALFKQATEGDIKSKKPGLTDLVGKAKYSAWERLKGMDSEKAMETYINRIESIRNKIR